MSDVNKLHDRVSLVLVGSVLGLSCALSACGDNGGDQSAFAGGAGAGGSGVVQVVPKDSTGCASDSSTSTTGAVATVRSILSTPQTSTGSSSTGSSCTSSTSTVSTGQTIHGFTLTPVTAQTATTTIQPGGTYTVTVTSVVTIPASITDGGFSVAITPSDGVEIDQGIGGTFYALAGTTISMPAGASDPAYVAPFSVNTQRGDMAATLTAQLYYVDAGMQASTGVGHIAFDASDNLYISEAGGITEVTGANNGTSIYGLANSYAEGIAVDASGNVYAGETIQIARGTVSSASIFQITPSGNASIYSPNWETKPQGLTTGYADYGQGGMAFDQQGTLYLADVYNNRIVMFDPAGVMSVFAGSGEADNVDGTGTAAGFMSPADLAIDSSNNVYVRSNTTLRKISPSGKVTTLAVNLPNPTYVQAIGSMQPLGSDAIAVDSAGNVYTAGIQVLYKVDPQGNITTYPLPVGKLGIFGLTEDPQGHLYAIDFNGAQYEIIQLIFQ